MASISLFGGGFFTRPFTSTYNFTNTVTSGAVAAFNAVHTGLVDSCPAGRWVEIHLWDNSVGGNALAFFYLALGPVGNEVRWQPVNVPIGGGGGALAGFMLNFIAAPNVGPWSWSFPVNLDPGQRLSCNLAVFGNAGVTALVEVVIFD